MSYSKTATLISRPVHQSGLSGIWDSITGAGKSVVNFYGSTEQAKGANAVLTAQNAALTGGGGIGYGGGGPGIGTIVVVGGLALGAFLLLKRKKST